MAGNGCCRYFGKRWRRRGQASFDREGRGFQVGWVGAGKQWAPRAGGAIALLRLGLFGLAAEPRQAGLGHPVSIAGAAVRAVRTRSSLRDGVVEGLTRVGGGRCFLLGPLRRAATLAPLTSSSSFRPFGCSPSRAAGLFGRTCRPPPLRGQAREIWFRAWPDLSPPVGFLPGIMVVFGRCQEAGHDIS